MKYSLRKEFSIQPSLPATRSYSQSLPSMRAWKDLCKSGIVLLVAVTFICGYLIGQRLELTLRWAHFAWALVGTILISAGSAALNQIQEIKTDALMPRTQGRPLVTGEIPLGAAIGVTVSFISSGLYILYRVSFIAFTYAALAIVLYNIFYTLWWKRHHAFAAVPGAIPGALPILMGYTAAAQVWIDRTGLYLFMILFFWQMPHFWALTLRYSEDYSKGKIPTLPVVFGSVTTLEHISIWTLGYVAVLVGAPLFFPASSIFIFSAIVGSFIILYQLKRLHTLGPAKGWLGFFLTINFSLLLLLMIACLDVWSIYLTPWLSSVGR